MKKNEHAQDATLVYPASLFGKPLHNKKLHRDRDRDQDAPLLVSKVRTASEIGRRETNEDRFKVESNFVVTGDKVHNDVADASLSFFGMFDGHAGCLAADLWKDTVVQFFVDNLKKGMSPNDAFIETYRQIERRDRHYCIIHTRQ